MTVAERDHTILQTAFGDLVRMRSCLPGRRLMSAVGMAVCLLAAHPLFAAVSDWDDATRSLFTAIEAGDLVAVQRAVLDGADIRATDDTGKNPAELAEELGHFTITHFLLAYGALEAPPKEPAQPAPEPETTATVAVPAATEESAPVEEEIVSPATPEPQPERIESSYFERLSTLNPPPRGSNQATVTAAAPAVQQAETAEVVAEVPAPEPMPEAVPEPAPEAVAEEVGTEAVPMTVPAPRKPALGEGTVVRMEPAPGPELSEEDIAALAEQPLSGGETSGAGGGVTAAEEPATPAAASEQTAEAASSGAAGGSFIAGLRRVEGGDPGTLTPEDMAAAPPAGESGDGTFVAEIPGAESYPAPGGETRTAEGLTEGRIPEHNDLRNAAIERLKRESAERLSQLDEARRVAAGEREVDEQKRLFQQGVANVEAEARAQQRLALTGSPYPPGFVPPPDGGTSAVRFLQRLGIVGPETRTVASEPAPGLLSPAKPNDESAMGVMGPVAQANPEDAVTPQDLRVLTFIDSGYAPPPAGREIDTDDDKAVNALQQIARLLSTPDQKFPATATDGTAQPPAGQTLSQAPAAPTVPSITAQPTTQVAAAPTPMPPGDVPLPAAAFEELIAGEGEDEYAPPPLPAQPQALASGPTITEGWGATATDPGGDVLAAAPQSEAPAEPQSGLVDRLSSLFDPNDPGAVGSGGAIRSLTGEPPAITEPTGSWDVVDVVPAAPPPPRLLLGGPVQQHVPEGLPRNDLTLAIGRTVLGKAPPVNDDPQSLRRPCVDKRRGSVTFCIESVEWPSELQSLMRVDTVMYQGLNMISRYDNGVATRFYALFPSQNFEQIAKYLAATMGQPTSVWKRTIAPLAQPRAENPTVIWKTVNPETQAVSLLEIRQYDDTRGGFPDEERGAIMLYRAQSGPIFPQVSALELMRLRPG